MDDITITRLTEILNTLDDSTLYRLNSYLPSLIRSLDDHTAALKEHTLALQNFKS